jgi:O-6-methylguanine DNA methyltransferase
MAGERIWYSSYGSALGVVYAACTARGVTDVCIRPVQAQRARQEVFSKRLRRIHGPGARVVEDEAPFRELFSSFDLYFSGVPVEFDVALEVRGTAFEMAVWGALRAIPWGETISYATAAARAGAPGAARAAGTACSRNPLPIIVPCHRVIRADNTLGRYSGGGGAGTKRALLDIEGARYKEN